MRLRIMTYNILVGGIGPRGVDRTERLLSVIEGERPDVLALQECHGFFPDERGAVAAYEKRLGLTGILGRCESKLHVAVLARPELDLRLEGHTGAPLRHGALHVSIAVPGGRLSILTVHLNPFLEDARFDELVHLAPHIPPGPALLLGDFNGLSPQDSYSAKELAEMLAQYRITPHYKSLGNPQPDRPQTRALAHLLETGWVDLGHAFPGAERPCTYPTPGAPDPEGPPIRIDYVLARPALVDSVRAYRTLRAPPADTASDHYPVVVDLEL